MSLIKKKKEMSLFYKQEGKCPQRARCYNKKDAEKIRDGRSLSFNFIINFKLHFQATAKLAVKLSNIFIFVE